MFKLAHNIFRQSTDIQKIIASDLVSTVTNEITAKKEKMEIFEKKLSKILRSLESNSNSAVKPVMKDLKMFGKNGKSGKKKGDGDKDWMSYQGLMLYDGDPNLGEARIYFDSVSTLRDEVFSLEEIEKTLKKLLASGMKDETRCSILFKNGMPVKLVFRPADEKSLTKLSFEGSFSMQ